MVGPRKMRSVTLFLTGASLPFVALFDRSLLLAQLADNRAAQLSTLVMPPSVERQVDVTGHNETTLINDVTLLPPPVKEIYCLCPAGSQTGGPEALHQLCNEINLADTPNVNASMLYLRFDQKGIHHDPNAQEPAQYKELYHSKVAKTMNPLTQEHSSPNKLLIWPEILVSAMMNYLNSTSNPCQCAIYWLSVDKYKGSFQDWHRNDIIHLAQSEYARKYVLKQGATNVFPLKEYIPRIPRKLPKGNRTIDVIYNPKKGIKYTNAIREKSGSRIHFQAIAAPRRRRRRKGGKLSPEQVQTMLKKAKVYIDFGEHPGMDRIPREAALAGCIVVTNREGSAAFRQDVPIPSQYKIKDFDVDAIDKLLMELVNNYETHTQNFRRYRTWIRGQRKRMKQHIAAFLEQVVEKRHNVNNASTVHILQTPSLAMED